jgi:hypothetical protein
LISFIFGSIKSRFEIEKNAFETKIGKNIQIYSRNAVPHFWQIQQLVAQDKQFEIEKKLENVARASTLRDPNIKKQIFISFNSHFFVCPVWERM